MKPAHSNGLVNMFLELAEREDNAGRPAHAVAAYTAAALSDCWDAWLSVALVLEQESDCDQRLALFFRKKYFDALTASADAGDLLAIRRLAGLYEFGQSGVASDPERALDLFERAASMGDVSSMFELFEKHFYGLCSAKKDKHAALKWLQLSAQHDHDEAKEWVLRIAEWDKKNP
jgi:TPR repeat protein